jgi:hypothetical protein
MIPKSIRLALIVSLLTIAAIALAFPFRSGSAQKNDPASTSRRAGPSNYDAFGVGGKLSSSAALAAGALNGAQPRLEGGHLVQTEARLAVPTFLWATETSRGQVRQLSSATAQAKTQIESAAREHFGGNASRYRLSQTDVAEARLAAIHDTGKGAIIVKFKQDIAGVEVFRDEINVIMNRDLQLIALSGYLTGANDGIAAASTDFSVNPESALSKALEDLTGSAVNSSALKGVAQTGANPYLLFTVDSTPNFSLTEEPARVKKVFYHLIGEYVPAYYVEVDILVPTLAATGGNILLASGGTAPLELAYSYVISAADGQVLFRNNLMAEVNPGQKVAPETNLLGPGGFTYRVWADPVTGLPYDTPAGNGPHPKLIASPDGAQAPFVPLSDVTLPNYPFSQNDPWLAPGATQTAGNNVDAFLNLFTPDGLGNPVTTTPTEPPTGDFRAQITAAGQFLNAHVADGNTASAAARQGAIQQLFYNVNFLHDWFYDAGFNEASGNAQTNNFGRGGVQNDSIKAQAQDFQSFSNANMLTPADGAQPRMRMYVFPSPTSTLDISAPASIVASPRIGISMSGPQTFDITADIVKATFSNSPSSCTITNAAALNGKLALFDFDNTDGTGCSFSTRISRITATGATAMIMAYTSGSPTSIANITGFVTANTKPVSTIAWNSSTPIKTELTAGNTVTARLHRVPDRDGTVDNQIVFHEWGHYISNRLIGNGNGLNTNMAGGMGEGWGDFNAMLALTVRADDTATASNANWNGAYALATYATGAPNVNNAYYFGIRRYPYSTDMTINPLTFKHVQNGIALPVGPPVAFGQSGTTNSEVHNTGEVWSNMLWECYAALLRDTQGAAPRLTFAQAQDRMRNYIVASYKMTPISPTFLEARDAVLAAAFAYDYQDGLLFGQAFAKRGAGINAISPDRYSATNSVVTESFEAAGALSYVSSTLDDSVDNCDADSYLDSSEKGLLHVTLKNNGFQNLFNTTATVSSDNPHVSFPNGATINFGPTQPGQNVSAAVVVAVNGAVGIEESNFSITFQDSGSPAVTPVTVNWIERLNVNEIPAASATDNVEAKPTVWVVTSNPALAIGAAQQWRRTQDAGSSNHVWFAPDPYVGSDQYLTGPVMTVDGSGSMNLQFDHSWGFEFDGGGNYDGGVVEASVNGGAFADIGAAAYNGTILNYSGDVNPLKGRVGFVQNSAGTIHTSLTQAIAPGSTVQIRFRVGTDNGVGSTGWRVDNIAFTGTVETPFAVLVAESITCHPAPSPTPVIISLSPSTLSAGSVGTPYSVLLTPSGGTGPYSYTTTPVILPQGFSSSVVSGNLQISGTPTHATALLFTVNVSDSAAHTSNVNFAITINKGTPIITWSNPVDIIYPTALSGTQLNASASVPGVLTYTPPATTVLNAGNAQTLSVNFVPTDTTNYSNASREVLINVLKVTPVITWSNPPDITYPTILSASELNATADVPGVLTYIPAAATLLNAGNAQTLSVNFVPTDTVNYNNASKNVSINVLKASPTITWSNPGDITYPAALSSTQLNATANVPGVLTYTPPETTVLNAGSGQTLTVDFVPTDTTNYVNTSKNVSINVLKATSTITWSNPADISYPAALSSTQLNATANVPGVLTYTPPESTVLNAGSGQTLTVDFVPTDTTNYVNTSKNVSINVLKATSTITWSNPADITYPTALSATQLNASANVPGSFTYAPPTGMVLNAGSGQTLTADFVPDDTTNYNNAAKNVTINVLKAQPVITWSNPGDINYGTPLSATELNATANTPGTFSYTPAIGVVLGAGNSQDLSVLFVPTDTSNYSNNSATALINVLKATTATSVSSSVNPSDLGQTVTFTATVTSAGGVPSGTVQFKVDGANSGSPQTLNGSGIATFSSSALTATTHAIAADYNGNGNFGTSSGTLVGGQVVRGEPSISINDVSIGEGDSGTKLANFTVTLSSASDLTVTVNFATANGTANSSDYQSTSGTVTFNPTQTSQTISVTLNADTAFEPDDTYFVNLSSAGNASIADNQGLGTIVNDDAQGGIFSFSQSTYSVGESDGVITITVNRSGELGASASVGYATADNSASSTVIPCSTVNGTASSRCDFTAASGRLTFAASESSKTFTILISQDSFVEGGETFPITLLDPTGGAVFATPSTATVTINDDFTEPSTNPIDDSEVFVRTHYHDFLNREADSAGLAFWVDNINKCNDAARRPAGQTVAQCIANQRVSTSAAFFLSIEFQDTGYLVYRLNGASFGNIPGTPVPVRFDEFMADTQQIGQGVVVGQSGWQALLENHKQAFVLAFVQRPGFVSAYAATSTPSSFVDGLFLNAGVTPTTAERNAAIAEFGAATTSADINARARSLRRVADNAAVIQQHMNQAFVLMEYFGYMRRNPDAAPDNNFAGYNFWLNKLNQFNGNFINADMVNAFISSTEYRRRFGN